jgi:hypothetical protein
MLPMDWIAKRIREARTVTPVADAVAVRLEKELKETLCERSLRNAEFADLAKALIAASEPPKSGAAP